MGNKTLALLIALCCGSVQAAPLESEKAKNEFVFLLPPGYGSSQLFSKISTNLEPPREDNYQSARDSYGNPVQPFWGSLNYSKEGKQIVDAAGIQFPIPSYASGITAIKKPTNELLPPLSSGEVPEKVLQTPAINPPSIELLPPLGSDETVGVPKDVTANEIFVQQTPSNSIPTEEAPRNDNNVSDISSPKIEEIEDEKKENPNREVVSNTSSTDDLVYNNSNAFIKPTSPTTYSESQTQNLQKNNIHNPIVTNSVFDSTFSTGLVNHQSTSEKDPSLISSNSDIPNQHIKPTQTPLAQRFDLPFDDKLRPQSPLLPPGKPTAIETPSIILQAPQPTLENTNEKPLFLYQSEREESNNDNKDFAQAPSYESNKNYAKGVGVSVPKNITIGELGGSKDSETKKNIGAFVGIENSPDKYTGGFGGPPGILGNQLKPGFAIQSDGSIKDPDHTYKPPTNLPAQPVTSILQSASTNPTKYEKYTGGFGGPPGVLAPYDNN